MVSYIYPANHAPGVQIGYALGVIISRVRTAWKVLENKGQSWKVLENKICLEKPLKTVGLDKYLNFTFSCILDNFKSLWESKVKFLEKKSASFGQRQRCKSAIIKEVGCAGHENKVRIHIGSNDSYLMSPLQTGTWRFWQLLLLKKVNSNNQTKQKTKMASAVLYCVCMFFCCFFFVLFFFFFFLFVCLFFVLTLNLFQRNGNVCL